MPRDRWLLLDADGLMNRSWYAIKMFPNGAIHGILRDISILQERFDTEHVAFCFDEGDSFRKGEYPAYKANRNRAGKDDLYRQIRLVKEEILAEAGFSNIYFQNGFEADDWLAYLSRRDIEAVVVSRDHDMHQLVTEDRRVICFDPQTKDEFNWDHFLERYQMVPSEWNKVRAYAGCQSDNIKGLKGVGPDTAIKILKGTASEYMSGRGQAFRASGEYDFNLRLVTLPWVEDQIELDLFEFAPDNVTQERWTKVCQKHNVESLIPRCPRITGAQA